MATLDDGTWHCMTDAPRDGTEVELLVRHMPLAAHRNQSVNLRVDFVRRGS